MPSCARTILTVLWVLIAGRAMGADVAFDLEAHRGGRALLPENTLPAFANTLSIGVDTLELDVGVTADGDAIVSHERALNPDLARRSDGVYITSPGTPFVKLRLDEVRSYDVGQIRPDSAYAKQFRPACGAGDAHSHLARAVCAGAQVRQHVGAPQHRDQDRSEPSR